MNSSQYNAPRILRGGYVQKSYPATFYTQGKSDTIVGLQCDNINEGVPFGNETPNRITLEIGNMVKGLIEREARKGSEIDMDQILGELNIVFEDDILAERSQTDKRVDGILKAA